MHLLTWVMTMMICQMNIKTQGSINNRNKGIARVQTGQFGGYGGRDSSSPHNNKGKSSVSYKMSSICNHIESM